MTEKYDLQRLASVPKEGHSLYMEGIGGVMKSSFSGLGEWGYSPIDPSLIKVVYGRPKPLSTDALKGVIGRREKFEKARGSPITSEGNNPLTVTHTPYEKEDKIVLERYLTDFASWMFTRPKEDEFSHLFKSPEDIHYSFFISVLPVTSDEKVVIPNRGDRITYNNGVFVFTGGYGRDKDVPENLWQCEADMIKYGDGWGLWKQAMMIPADQYGLVEKEGDHIKAGSGLLGILNSDPAIGELGHHIAAIVYLDTDSKQVLESANKKWGTQKKGARFNVFSKENVFPYEPEVLVKFANGEIGSNPLVKTQVPLVWLAITKDFGEKYLERIKGLERLV